MQNGADRIRMAMEEAFNRLPDGTERILVVITREEYPRVYTGGQASRKGVILALAVLMHDWGIKPGELMDYYRAMDFVTEDS